MSKRSKNKPASAALEFGFREQIRAFDALMLKLRKQSLNWTDFTRELERIYPEFIELANVDNCQAFGMDFTLTSQGQVYLNTRARKLEEQRFCVVDIETSANSPRDGQIIEIGALMWQHGQILGEFSELIYAPSVPEKIIELTGITSQMLHNARDIKRVLSDFRAFLGDAIFVAHGAHFDYNFIAKSSMDVLNAPLLNRRIDTIKLAKNCIDAPKYGLQTLKELLGIQNRQHRALNDARACACVLDFCICALRSRCFVSEDLLKFS